MYELQYFTSIFAASVTNLSMTHCHSALQEKLETVEIEMIFTTSNDYVGIFTSSGYFRYDFLVFTIIPPLCIRSNRGSLFPIPVQNLLLRLFL